VNTTAVDQMSDAIAHATQVFAMAKSVNSTDSNSAKGTMQFKGSKLLR
jgi:hypothetical protein